MIPCIMYVLYVHRYTTNMLRARVSMGFSEPPGASMCILSQAHRDGGFPTLGWQECPANRFRWEITDGSLALSLGSTVNLSDSSPTGLL